MDVIELPLGQIIPYACQRRRQNRPRGGAKVGHLTAVAALLGAMGRALSI
jgi:hypothetical protein